MWEVNRLNGARFYAGLGDFTVTSDGYWDNTEAHMLNGLYPVRFTASSNDDLNNALTSYKLQVRPTEKFSASIFCKTFDYTKFNASDPQVTLTLKGYSTKTSSAIILGTISKNKADFPAQDWFRLGIEGITVPAGIHYLELVATMKRSGDILFLYPCIEFGSKVTDVNIYNSDIGGYYNTIIYDGIPETDELIKTQNSAFDEINQVTEKVQRNFYIFTCEEEGLTYYEEELDIVADPDNETMEFRRQRILNRLSNLVPYTFPFLQTKLDQLIGTGLWDAYIDFAHYTLYIEYAASNYLWSDEVKITIHDIKPCNIVFKSVPRVGHKIGMSEQVSLQTYQNNYSFGKWKLGEKAFASFNYIGVLKMANLSSIQDAMLTLHANHTISDIVKVALSDGSTTKYVTDFDTKSVSAGVSTISYSVGTSLGLSEITSIQLLTSDNTVLTSSAVYVPISEDNLITHTINHSEVTS